MWDCDTMPWLQSHRMAFVDLGEVPQVLNRVAQKQMDVVLPFVSCTREEEM